MKGKYLHPSLCFRPWLRLRSYVLKALGRRPRRHTRVPAAAIVEEPVAVEELEELVVEEQGVLDNQDLDGMDLNDLGNVFRPYRGPPPHAQWAKARPASLKESSEILGNFWAAYTTWADVRILDAAEHHQDRSIAIQAVNEAVREAQNFSLLRAQSRQEGTAISKLRNYGWNGRDVAHCPGDANEAREISKRAGHGRTFSDDDYY